MDSAWDTRCRVGYPIRISRDQRSLASPPGFSQRATSFIASQCQGIHQMPLLALERHTQRQRPLQYQTDTAGRSRQVRQILLLPAKPRTIPRFRRSEDTSSRDRYMPPTGQTLTGHDQRPRVRRSCASPDPATVTQLASSRLSINSMPRRPTGLQRQFLTLRHVMRLSLSYSRRTIAVKAALSPEVEVIGIEPTTPCLQSRCSPS